MSNIILDGKMKYIGERENYLLIVISNLNYYCTEKVVLQIFTLILFNFASGHR